VRVLILGSGLAGITSAYYLSKLGCDVTVVDRAAGAGRETSFANGSMITPSLADPWNAPGVFGALIRSLGREDSAILLRAGAIPSLFRLGHFVSAQFRVEDSSSATISATSGWCITRNRSCAT
jgi:D-amino-acid dehydrogenase